MFTSDITRCLNSYLKNNTRNIVVSLNHKERWQYLHYDQIFTTLVCAIYSETIKFKNTQHKNVTKFETHEYNL